MIGPHAVCICHRQGPISECVRPCSLVPESFGFPFPFGGACGALSHGRHPRVSFLKECALVIFLSISFGRDDEKFLSPPARPIQLDDFLE